MKKKEREKFVKIIVQTDEDKKRFADYKRVVYGNGGNPFDILMMLAEAYVQKYNPHQHPLVSRTRIFEIAKELKVSFTDNDFNYYKKSAYLIEETHYVKMLVNKRYKFVYHEKEMTRFLKWLKKYRRTRMLSLRDKKRFERQKRQKELQDKPELKPIEQQVNEWAQREDAQNAESLKEEIKVKITPMRNYYD